MIHPYQLWFPHYIPHAFTSHQSHLHPPSTPDVARCSARAAAPRSRSSERSARAAWRSPPRTLGVPTVAPGAKIWSIPLIFDFPSDVGSFPGCFGWFGVEMFKNARMIEIWMFFKPKSLPNHDCGRWMSGRLCKGPIPNVSMKLWSLHIAHNLFKFI